MRPLSYCGVFALGLMQSAAVRAGERLSLANVPAPPPLVADEPLARAFSLERAAQSLDTSALHWQKTRKCAACHTMAPYLMARSALAAVEGFGEPDIEFSGAERGLDRIAGPRGQ